jgi:hypothetical protein
MSKTYFVRSGGLMRCCLATIEERMPTCADEPKEGEKLQCRHHDGDGMIYRDGAWEWNRTPDA